MSIVSIAPCSWAIFCSSVIAATRLSARSRADSDMSCQAGLMRTSVSPPARVRPTGVERAAKVSFRLGSGSTDDEVNANCALGDVRRGGSEEHASLEVTTTAAESDQSCGLLARD